MSASAPEPRGSWAVVCPNYVSHHPTQEAAMRHREALLGKQCRAPHDVVFTRLPKGSRLRGEASP